MFIVIEAHAYADHAALIDAMHVLRKRVFADELQWDVPVVDDRERDVYDKLKPAYLIWCDEERRTLYGSARLMPTTAPTLLADVFGRTLPERFDLRDPGLWECTRLCVDAETIERDLPDTTPQQGFRLMMLALCEVGVRYGMTGLLSNYEPHVMRLYRSSGASVDEIGRADGYGRRPVCCGLFDVSVGALKRMRRAMGVTKALCTFPGSARAASPSWADVTRALPCHAADRAAERGVVPAI